MTLHPQHREPNDAFPGDPSPEPVLGLTDAARSLWRWSVGLPHLAAWSLGLRLAAQRRDLKHEDRLFKILCDYSSRLAGLEVRVRGGQSIDQAKTHVYVCNHVNIFDLFVMYQAIPQLVRALEHADHFEWPLVGPFITAAGQIPLDPNVPLSAARGLRRAASYLEQGISLAVLPEGERTLDGTVGPFYSGAFRLAIKAKVPVVPMAIRGGRRISRRGDWRMRAGAEEVLLGAPIPTSALHLRDATALATTARQAVIDLLHGRIEPS
ncbi:MAG: 1-acyl-sn-glycerol-3-phosphate acyltransferase [Myxococcota bacterium]|nr:1-acyl-sn-glycerol-3-phosphate acyltransferase [Myxococcota bacterium]